ncbi:hypothetical protein D3C71_1600380 [compost metagenome]
MTSDWKDWWTSCIATETEPAWRNSGLDHGHKRCRINRDAPNRCRRLGRDADMNRSRHLASGQTAILGMFGVFRLTRTMHPAMAGMRINRMLRMTVGTLGGTDNHFRGGGKCHRTGAEASDQGLQRHQHADQSGQRAAAKSVSDKVPKETHG